MGKTTLAEDFEHHLKNLIEFCEHFCFYLTIVILVLWLWFVIIIVCELLVTVSDHQIVMTWSRIVNIMVLTKMRRHRSMVTMWSGMVSVR